MPLTSFPASLENNFLLPAKDKRGRYKNSEGIHDTNHRAEAARIFFETQAKRLMHALFPWVKKFKYFSKNEKAEDIYQLDPIQERVTSGCKVHNVGHASKLIQFAGINILTDPVVGSLNRVLYPAMTKAGVDIANLPPIDVILISHTHRDHVDEEFLKHFVSQQPALLVPKGSAKLFKDLGFTNVGEFEWYDQVSMPKSGIQFTAVPADHWSGRGLFDTNRSCTNGWLINKKDEDGIFYFAGDTAKLSSEKMKALSFLIYQRAKGKTKENLDLKIYNLQPAGPNYTRKDMQSTHQSILESLMTAFELANNIHQLELELETDATKRKSAKDWLNCVATILMHHNKYQLGPDRFNEALFIFERVMSLLRNHGNKYIQNLAEKERNKNFLQNLFHRNKAFIYEGVLQLRMLSEKIWPGDAGVANENLINFLRTRTHAPKIGQALDESNCFPKIDEQSTSSYRPVINRGR